MNKLTSAQKWMINAGAILADENDMPDDRLHAFDSNDDHKVNTVIRMFNDDWGVDNIDALIGIMNNFITEKGGHNISFCETRNYWARFSAQQAHQGMQHYNDDQQSDIQLALTHAHSIGPAGVLSWDLARCVPMLRNAYSLSWIGEEEVWKNLQTISIKLQKSYQSWEQAGTAYIVGRLFWAKGGLSESTCHYYFSMLKRILINPEHAWNTIDWDTKLCEKVI